MCKQSLIFKDFGNVSLRKKDHIIIKGSGRSMSNLQNSDLVKVQLYNGKYNSKIKPSSDTPTHLMIYNAFDEINGVVHSHSTYATAWAQAGVPIPCYGTTHADYW